MRRPRPPLTRTRGALRAPMAALVLIATGAALLAAPAGAVPCTTCVYTPYMATGTPAAAQVGGTYVPLVGDFAGDGADDVFWYAPGKATDWLWTFSTTRGSFTRQEKPVNGTYRPVVANIAGDDKDDIVWYAPGTAADALWTSVPTSARFRSDPLSVDGTYEPVALDASLRPPTRPPGPATRADTIEDKDTLVWFRRGSSTHPVWTFDRAGVRTSRSVALPPKATLVALNVDADRTEDLLAYTPGTGADAIVRHDDGTFISQPVTVNGSYRPVVLGAGHTDSILWHGPGTAPDAYWMNDGTGSFLSRPTAAVTTTGPIAPITGRMGYLYDPSGDDLVYVNGRVHLSTTPDIGTGARPVVGDLDGDGGLDALFYRPGTGREVLAYGYPYWTSTE